MKFTSTRGHAEAESLEAILRGLAPDGGLYVPSSMPGVRYCAAECRTLAEAERFALGAFFDDVPVAVRDAAIANLLAKFPKDDPVPLRGVGAFHVLELFHGPTGAFKDVALSVLPVLLKAAAGERRVLVLTATSGDTGSAAMAGFAGVPGVEVEVFFPNVGTSRVQRLQMTTPSERNVFAVAIRGNFDDAQAAVKRIFADESVRAEASAAGVTLSSANSINAGRLVPQVAYYLMAASRLAPASFDVVVPSGNFGNILAAYYARLLGAPVRRLVCASNVNDVLARFVKTGVYDPGDKFTVTNSPSMDIRKSSNVERLLWLLNGGFDDPERAAAETKRLMDDFAAHGRYELSAAAMELLSRDFVSGVATPEETEDEMRRTREETGYVLDPHTAVALRVARDLGFPREGAPCVVAATATPYKFPETCMRAFGENVLSNPPPAFRSLESAPVTQKQVVDVAGIDDAVRARWR